MPITGYTFSGYKSFNTEGVTLPHLSKCNILIGANNHGKTNILELLNLFGGIIRNAKPTQAINVGRNLFDELHKYNKNTPIKLTVHFEIPENDREQFTKDQKLLVPQTNLFVTYSIRALGNNDMSLSITDTFLHHLDEDNIRTYVHNVKGKSGGKIEELVNETVNSFNPTKFYNMDNVIYIDEHYRFSSSQSVELRPIVNPNYQEKERSQRILKEFNDFVKSAFGEELFITIPDTNREIEVELKGFQQPLNAYGSGVSRIISLAHKIALIEKPSIVCIDEPEKHLHPRAQRSLLEFLVKKTPHRYFFATHSNTFLDFIDNKSVYKVSKHGDSSEVEYCDNIQSQREILNDLGIRASELLQANGIIWVEGACDRIYIKAWLNLLRPDLQEGLHYTFQFYGGKNLSWFTAEDDAEDLIQILKTNRNAYIVMDSDMEDTYTTDQLRKTKRRIIAECENSGIGYWITHGREIENYLDSDLLAKVTGESVPVQMFKKPGEYIPNFSNKVSFAKKVIDKMDRKTIEIQDGLKKTLSNLVREIEKWNV